MRKHQPIFDQDISSSPMANMAETADTTNIGNPVLDGFGPRMSVWMLRMLCEGNVAWSDEFQRARFIADTAKLLPAPKETCSDAELVAHYRKLLKRQVDSSIKTDGALARNLTELGRGLGLGEVELDILAFLFLYDALPCFEHLVDIAIIRTDAGRVAWQLASILDCSHRDVEDALSPSSVLTTAGLIQLNERMKNVQLGVLLDLNHRMLRLLTQSQFSIQDLMHYAARPCRASSLVLDDYDFMESQRDLVIRYLAAVQESGAHPVSVLLDGPPGVGKSELARFIAAHLGFDAWEVNEVDEDGDPAMPGERVQYLRICHRLLKQRDKGLILFDESDAVLGGHLDDHRRAMRSSKAGLIRLLETLEVPVIWITNHGDLIDPAVLRRLDLTIRFGPMPRAARERMLARSLAGQPSQPAWLIELGKLGQVTPARISQADRIARLMAGTDDDAHARLFRQVMEENLALRLDKGTVPKRDNFELPYRLESINADEDLSALTAALKRAPRARLCLYGPPGTGKTRFVKHLASHCGLKLAEHRASDLLDKWVGGSERNIRKMFEENDRPDRLLFLDEADSLVANRESAHRGWEVNQVNELLKGLENFQGLFVASTNLMDRLDSAVLRRLDFKIHFGWLKPDQRWRLFLDLAAHIGLKVRGTAASQARRIVDQLDCLTPGDFAMLARRLTIRPAVTTGQELAELLAGEMRLKPEVKFRSAMGFTAAIGQ